MFPAHGVLLKDFKREWFWLVVFVTTLFGFNGGWVNAIAFLGVWKTGLSHLTGLTTNGAIRVINPAKPGQITEVQFITYITGFYVGATVAGFIIGVPRLRWGRLQGLVLLCCGTTLFFAWLLAEKYVTFSGWLVTFAMGGQNAITTLFSGGTLRNTHVSGHVLDLGIATGQTLRNLNTANVWKIQVNLPTYMGFWAGALCGTMVYNHLLMDALLCSSIACLVVGCITIPVCTLYKVYSQGKPDPTEVQMEPNYDTLADEDTEDESPNGEQVRMNSLTPGTGTVKG